MKHTGTVELHTNRITLRKMCIDDATMIFKNFASDSEVASFLPWNRHNSIEDTYQMINKYNKYRNNKDYYLWGLVEQKSNELFGYVRVISIDEQYSTIEVEYCTGKSFWNHHYTTESLHAVLDYLFNVVGVNVVTAKHPIDNAHSGRVMRRCGFKHVKDIFITKGDKEIMYRYYELEKSDFRDLDLN